MDISKNDSSFKQVLTISLIIFTGRLIIIPFSGVMPQDAYYYMYSRDMSLSYFDHPAGVAVLIKVGTFLLGNTPAAVKLCAFFTSLFSLFVIYRLALQFISKQRAFIFICVLGCTPMFGILSWIVTPDVPVILCWALAVLFIYKADSENKPIWWALAGIFTGLAFDSKYTAVFILAGLFFYLIARPDRWRRIFSIGIFIYVLALAVTVLPVFIWNMENNWASIHFQTAQRFRGLSPSLNPQYPVGVMAIQMFLLLPWLFYYFLKSVRSYKKNNNHFFLVCFSFPLFIFFILISLFYWIKINWMMPAFITGALLGFQALSAKQVKWHMITATLFFILFTIEKVKQYFSDVRMIKTQVVSNIFGNDSRMVKYYFCTGYKGVEKK